MRDAYDLPVVRAVETAVRSILMDHSFITPARARAIVRVEVTPGGFTEIQAAVSLSDDVFADRPSRMREAARRGYGTFELMGVAYYLVPVLEQGHAWRVVNPMDVA